MIDMTHRERMIEDYWYLCRRAARRFLRPGIDRNDLEQVAAIGLIKAADRYDCQQSTPFEAYAWLLVLGELMHYVRDGERLLRAPRRVRELEKRWATAERELRGSLGREPREADVAQYLNAGFDERREIREYRASTHVISFDALATSDHRSRTGGYDDVLTRVVLERAMSQLTPLERRIVRGIHFEGIPVVELAKRLGYSRRHVTRLHRAAMTRLRHGFGNAS